MAPSAIIPNAYVIRQKQHDHVLDRRATANNKNNDGGHDHLYAIPEGGCQGKDGEDEDDDFYVDPAANGDTSGMCGSSTHEKIMHNLKRRSAIDVYHFQGMNHSGSDLENDETECDIVRPPSRSNLMAHGDDAEIANFEEQPYALRGGEEPDSKSDARYDSEVIEEYEGEIQRLEKLNATLTANVATLTAAALNSDCDTDVERLAPFAEEGWGGNDGKFGVEGGAGAITFTDTTIDREQQLLPPPTDDIYNDMILTEEHYLHQISKLQKANSKLQRKLDNKKRLIAQLSMNLKTAAEKITIAGREGQDWKARFCELKIQGEDRSRKRDEERRKDEEEADASRQIQLYQLQVLENELTGLLELIGRRSEAHAVARRRLLDAHHQNCAAGEWTSERPEETLQRVIRHLRRGDAAARPDACDAQAPYFASGTADLSSGAFNVWDSVTSLFGRPGHLEQQQQQQQRHHRQRQREHPWKQQQQQEVGKVDVDEHSTCLEERSFGEKHLCGVSVGTHDEGADDKLASDCSDESSRNSSTDSSSDSSIDGGKSNLHGGHKLAGAGEVCRAGIGDMEKVTVEANGKGRDITELPPLFTQACGNDFAISPREGTDSIQQYRSANPGVGAGVGSTGPADSIARLSNVGAPARGDSGVSCGNAEVDTNMSLSDEIHGRECLFETRSPTPASPHAGLRGRSSSSSTDESKHEEDDVCAQSTEECASVIDNVDAAGHRDGGSKDGAAGKLAVRSGHGCDAVPLEGGIQHCPEEQREHCSPAHNAEEEEAKAPWHGWGLSPPLDDVAATSNMNCTENLGIICIPSAGDDVEKEFVGTPDGEVISWDNVTCSMIDQHKRQQGQGETQGHHSVGQHSLAIQQMAFETKNEDELLDSDNIIPNAPFSPCDVIGDSSSVNGHSSFGSDNDSSGGSDDDSSEPGSDTGDDDADAADPKQILHSLHQHSREQQFARHHKAEGRLQDIETEECTPEFFGEAAGSSGGETSVDIRGGGNSYGDQLESTNKGNQCTMKGAKDGTELDEGRCSDNCDDDDEEEDLSHVGDLIILSNEESEVEAAEGVDSVAADHTACYSTARVSYAKEGLTLGSCVNDEINERINANGGDQDMDRYSFEGGNPCSRRYEADDDGSEEVTAETNDIKMDCNDVRKECLGYDMETNIHGGQSNASEEELSAFNASRGYAEDGKFVTSDGAEPERESKLPQLAVDIGTNVVCASLITLEEGTTRKSVLKGNEGHRENNQAEVSEFASDDGGHFEQEQDSEAALITKETLYAKPPDMNEYGGEHCVSTRQPEFCVMDADGDHALTRSISPNSKVPKEDGNGSKGRIRAWQHVPSQMDNIHLTKSALMPPTAKEQTFMDTSNNPFAELVGLISIAKNTANPNDDKSLSDAEMITVSSRIKGPLQPCVGGDVSMEIGESMSRMVAFDESDDDGYIAREAKDEDCSNPRAQPGEINVAANDGYIDEDYSGECCISGDESTEYGDEPDAGLASKSEKSQQLQELAATAHGETHESTEYGDEPDAELASKSEKSQQLQELAATAHGETQLNGDPEKTQPKAKTLEERSHRSGHAGDVPCGEEGSEEKRDEMPLEKKQVLKSDDVTSNIDQSLGGKEPASSFAPTGMPLNDEASIPSSIEVSRQTKRQASPTGTIASCSATAISAGTQARITAALEKKCVRRASHRNAIGVHKSFADTLEKVKEQNKSRFDGSDTDRSPAYYQNVILQYTATTKKKDNALSNRLPRRELFQRQGSSCSDLYVDIVTDIFQKPEDRQVLVTSRDIDKYQVPRYQPPILPPNFKRTGRGAPTFKKGQKDGYYIYKSSSGNEYAGHWKDGRRHGYGTARYRDGEVFNGEWRRGRRSGHGVLHLANSEVFDGYWRANKKHGLGVYYWSDGDVDVSWYEDDNRVESLRWTKDRRRAYMLDLESSRKDQISLVRAASIVKGWERKGETYDC